MSYSAWSLLRAVLSGRPTTLRALFALAVAAVGFATDGNAQQARTTPPEQVGLSTERLHRLDAFLDAQIARKQKAGALVLIARHGKIAYLQAHGMADLESARPLRADAMFRLYSMTKPVTSVALLTLYEQGKFQLTDPLENYIPAFRDVKVFAGLDAEGRMILEEPRRKITIQDVFRHTAGFTYGYFADTAVDRAYRTAGIEYGKLDSLQELVDKLATMPLLYQPGERWVYSFSHDVLAYLVEYFSGMRFDDYCRKTVFEPLGMTDTVFGVPATRAARYATSYSLDAAGALRADSAHNDTYAHFTGRPFGGSSLASTAQDYLLFSQMLLNGGELHGVQILGPKTVALMTSDNLPPTTASWGDGIRYGLGVSVLADPAQAGNLGSKGQFGWGGYASTSVVIDPQEALIALLFTQYTPTDSRFVSQFQTLVFQAITR
ncbi:MAG: estB 2 [Gammaproteobacteria bacterium]|nr:estB 2 [Gammaproteobacteria bacterium]